MSASLSCSRCGRTKPVSEFYRRRARRRGYSSECKGCHKGVPRYEDVEARRDRTLRRRYGITAAEYDRLLTEQGGRCVLCQREPDESRLHVDHDHETGRVRGLLCFHCNTTLGWLERVGLSRVAAYAATELLTLERMT